MTNDEIKDKYNQVENLLENALEKSKTIELIGEEENAELKAINTMLESLNEKFKQEIEKLETSSEWDKFCIAFFGETNAGKSTIIESLRIIYNEEKRRAEKVEQEQEYKAVLSKHCQDYNELVQSLEKINIDLERKKEGKPVKRMLQSIGLIVIGIVLGCMISHFGLI